MIVVVVESGCLRGNGSVEVVVKSCCLQGNGSTEAVRRRLDTLNNERQ